MEYDQKPVAKVQAMLKETKAEKNVEKKGTRAKDAEADARAGWKSWIHKRLLGGYREIASRGEEALESRGSGVDHEAPPREDGHPHEAGRRH